MLKRITLISMKLQNTIRKYPIQHQSLKMHFSERERETEREREREKEREMEREREGEREVKPLFFITLNTIINHIFSHYLQSTLKRFFNNCIDLR